MIKSIYSIIDKIINICIFINFLIITILVIIDAKNKKIGRKDILKIACTYFVSFFIAPIITTFLVDLGFKKLLSLIQHKESVEEQKEEFNIMFK